MSLVWICSSGSPATETMCRSGTTPFTCPTYEPGCEPRHDCSTSDIALPLTGCTSADAAGVDCRCA
jgi:hypothetical protein